MTLLKNKSHNILQVRKITINPFWSANERTEMKLKIYLSEAWMCSEFGINNTDVEQERVNRMKIRNTTSLYKNIFHTIFLRLEKYQNYISVYD